MFWIALMAAVELAGVVVDAETGRAVDDAYVQVLPNGPHTYTNRAGEFTFGTVPAGRLRVRVEALGYEAWEGELTGEEAVRIELVVAPVLLPSLLVDGAGPDPRQFGETMVQRHELRGLPSVGEPDVLRGLTILPGVANASDFSAVPYLRGAAPGYSIITLDGGHLFNPYHLGGFFSAVPEEIVDRVRVAPSVMRRDVESRLGGRIDISGRPAKSASGATANVGLVSAALSAEGTWREVGGLVAARRTYIDGVTNLLNSAGIISHRVPYQFTDLYTRLDWRTTSGNAVSASGYFTDEGARSAPNGFFSSGSNWDLDWDSNLFSVGYERTASLPVRFAASHSEFRMTLLGSVIELPDEALDASSEQSSDRAAASATIRAGSLMVDVGADVVSYELRHRVANPGSFLEFVLPALDIDDDVTGVGGFADVTSSVGPVDLVAGVRVESWSPGGVAWLPRVGMAWSALPGLVLNAGWAKTTQAVMSIRNDESPYSSLLGLDLLRGLPGSRPLPNGQEILLSGAWTASDALSVRVDLFQKRMDRLTIVPPVYRGEDTPLIVADSTVGASGRVHGFDVHAEGALAGTGYIASLSFEDNEMSTRGQGTYRPRFSRAWRGSLFVSRRVGESSRVGTRVFWGTGQPFTPLAGVVASHNPSDPFEPAPSLPVFGELNTETLPGYLRVDVYFDREWTFPVRGRDTRLSAYAQVLNLLNRQNGMFAVPEYGPDGTRLRQASQLPVLPTFGFRWSL